MRWEKLLAAFVAMVATGIFLGGVVYREVFADEPKASFPDWQLVMDTQAGCFKRGDRVILRTNDGTKISTIARTKVAHVDGRSGVVTLVERGQ